MPVKLIPKNTRFGRLVTTGKWRLKFNEAKGKSDAFFECICDCTVTTEVMGSWLRTGNTSSCGCLHRERFTRRRYHRRTKDWDTYQIWCGIYSRCYNPKKSGYEYYGARGIKMDESWLGENGFKNFLSAMGERPSVKHSIDRIDCYGDYEPANCRWATIDVQALNKRPRKSGYKRAPYKKEIRRRRPRGYRDMPNFNEEEWFANEKRK